VSGFAASLDPMDRVVIGNFNRSAFHIVRFGANGALDPTFAGGQPVETHFPFIGVRVHGTVTDAAGNVIAWGQIAESGLLARYRSTGELDPSFAGGKVLVPDVHSIVKILEQSDGKLVIVGSDGPNEMELARYDAVCASGPHPGRPKSREDHRSGRMRTTISFVPFGRVLST